MFSTCGDEVPRIQMSLGLSNVNFLIQPFNVALDHTVSELRIESMTFSSVSPKKF